MILAICDSCGVGYNGSEEGACPTCFPVWVAFEYRCWNCEVSICVSVQGERRGAGPPKVIESCMNCDVGMPVFLRELSKDMYRRWVAEEIAYDD